MVFWSRKNTTKDNDLVDRADRIIHRQDDAAIEPPTEYDSDIGPDLKHRLEKSEREILEDLDEMPVPEHLISEDMKEAGDLRDHTREGGWLSRMAEGLSRSTGKLTSGITDLLTKSRLDQKTLDGLEEILIEADLGPQTASKIIRTFSKDRFGKEVSEQQVRVALAETMAGILQPVAIPLEIRKPENGPFVVLICGVNGVGKTTTIGKLARILKDKQGHKVMMAMADTFRAAALEQLREWSQRVGCAFYAKDVGADAAAVAYEAYEKAKKENIDVLLIDTAGRLHNKSNLMAELEKITRVLKKHDESLPHAVLQVLDATTGQNAFAQVETFQSMMKVTGLIVTKLDGSAKGGVLVGLADRFGLPVHAIGIGEGLEDMRPFSAQAYANSLMGLPY